MGSRQASALSEMKQTLASPVQNSRLQASHELFPLASLVQPDKIENSPENSAA